jgi:hypothetical protein
MSSVLIEKTTSIESAWGITQDTAQRVSRARAMLALAVLEKQERRLRKALRDNLKAQEAITLIAALSSE